MKHLAHFFLQYLCIGLLSIPSAQALVFIDSYTQNLSGATRVVLSSDEASNGQHVYACAFNAQALNVFSRNPSNGALSFIETHKQGVNNVSGLQGAWNLTISPDGKHVYVAAFSENAIGIFSRDVDSGRLTFVQSLVNDNNNGLIRPNNLTFDTKSKHLYITSNEGVAVFSRDSNSGELSFIARYLSTDVTGISGATAVRVSHDGQSVYVTGRNDNSLVFFQRNADTGELSFSTRYANGLNGITGLGGAYDVQITPDDGLVFVSGSSDASIAVFSRASDGGLSYQRTYLNGTENIEGLLGVQGLQLSQDGSRLFAVGNSENALVMFDVLGSASTVGYLDFLEVIKEGTNGISTLSGINSVTADKNLHHVYTSALNDNSISAFSLDSADLRLSMSAPTDAQTEGTFNYTLTVENLGPATASAVTLTDTLPSQVSYNTVGSDSRCSENAGVVTCALGALNAGQTANVVLSVTANSTGTATNNANLSSPDPDGNLANNNAVASTQIVNQQLTTDLAVNLFVDTNPVNISRAFTYQIQVNNVGANDANNVVVLFNQPTGTSFVSNQTSVGSCSNSNNQVRCSFDTLKLNSTQLISITLRSPNQATDMTANVSVTSNEIDLQSSNNTAELVSQVQVITTDLELLSTVLNPASVELGQVLTYEAGVRNLATEAVQEVVLETTFTPTDAVRFVSASTTNPNVADTFNVCGDQGQGVVRCALETLDVLANPVSVQISVLPIAPGSLNANFTLSSNATDTDLANNQVDAAVVNVTGQAVDVALSIPSVSPDPAFVGDPLEYKFTLSNTNSFAAAQNVSLFISLPETVDYIGASAVQGSGCNETAGTVNCIIGNIAADSSVDLDVTVRPTIEDAVQISAQVSSDSFDPNSENNNSSRSVNVQAATADLELTGSATPNPVVVDDELSLNFTVTNKGPSQANNSQLELKLPTAVNYDVISAKVVNGNDCALESDTLRCSLGRLLVNTESQIVIKLQVHEAGAFTTSATVQSTVQETDASNNNAATETIVTQPLSLAQSQVYTNGSEGFTGLQSLFDLALSSDGQFLYASNFNQGGVTVLQREIRTGALSFVQFLSNNDEGVSSLGGAAQLALSSNETWLYVVGFSSNHLVVLQRNTSTGMLSFAQAITGEDIGLQTLQGPFAVIARDNFIYIADFNADALLVLRQQGTTDNSNLTGVQTVTGLDGLNGINDLEISTDGTQLYATSSLDHSLMVFTRNTSTGMLMQNQVVNSQTTNNNGAAITGLNGALAVLATPDNQYVYAAGGTDSALVLFRRNADNQLQYIQTLTDSNALNAVSDLALSTDGKYVYAAATNNNALTLLNRNTNTGILDVQNSLVQGVEEIQGLSGIRAVKVSPDGQHVYTASLNANAVGVFGLPSADLEISLTASSSQLNSGQEVIYNVLVKNLGPDRATSSLLDLQIPTGLSVLSINSTGFCQQNQQTFNCRLGSLEVDETKSLSVRVIAESANEFVTTASVSASQNDPVTSNNNVSLPLSVTGVANLVVGMIAEPPFSALNTEILYKISLINAGPDVASQIVLTNTLPSQLSFVSANLNGQACNFAEGLISCSLNELAAQGSVTAEIRATVLEAVVIDNIVDVTSASLDLSMPNQAIATIRPSSNVVSTEIDNTGQVLSNVQITATGIVNGGTVAGIVQNQGRLNDVIIASDAQVSGGGSLSGTITNQGEIQAAQLLANSELSGGRITGLLEGSESLVANLLPRINNVRVEAGAEIRNVQIDDSVVLDDLAVLGVGTKFSNADLIPIGKDISSLFAVLQETFTLGQALNVDFSPTLDSQDNVLLGLNSSPDLQGLRFIQTGWGHLFFNLEPFIINTTPVQVIRREPLVPSSLALTSEGSAKFISSNQFEVLLQPALRDPEALDFILQTAALDARSLQDGNVEILLPANSGKLLVRPDWFAAPADPSLDPGGSPAALGLQAVESLPTASYAVLFFDDSLGTRLQQVLYPTVANRSAWFNNTSLSQVDLPSNGLVSFTQNTQTYQGVFDFLVFPSNLDTGNTMSIAETNDHNQDGIADLVVTYPNGEQQRIFLQ